MKKIKFLALAAALVVCATASAQFSNVKRTGSSNSVSAGLEKGYHAFIEAGYGVGTGDYGVDRIELSTTHGYQINPYIFVGGGLGVNYYHSPDLWSMPIFANARVNFINSKISPFFDLKIGAAIGLTNNSESSYSGEAKGSVSGFYFSPSIGCRFNKFTISAGYELQHLSAEAKYTSYSNYYYNGSYYYKPNTYTIEDSGTSSAFVFKVGVEL